MERWYPGTGSLDLGAASATEPFRPFYGMDGTPSFGGGVWGVLAQLASSMAAQRAMAPLGMVPLGFSERNYYDRLRHIQLTEAFREIQSSMAQYDVNTIMQLQRGVAALTGTRWTAEMQVAAERSSQMIGAALPTLALIAPDFLDKALGERGSATVFSSRALQAGALRLDPVTGRPMHYDSQGLAQFAHDLYGDLFGSERWRERQGLGSAVYANYYFEMQRRGMLPGMEEEGLPANWRDNEWLRGQGENRIRTMRQRVAQQLKNYQEAVVAVRELFGDAGRPDAPMVELIESLNSLTGGGLSQLNASQVGSTVRTLGRLATTAGVGLAGLQAATQETVAISQQLNINPLFASAATQSALAFQIAYGQSGLGSVPIAGVGNVNELRMLESTRALQAATSLGGNQLGLLARLQGIYGDQLSSSVEVQRYLAGLRSGRQFVNDSAFAEIVSRATGTPIEQLMVMLQQTEANQLALAGRPDLIHTARASQLGDVRRILSNVAAGHFWQLAGGDASRADQMGLAFAEMLTNVDARQRKRFLEGNLDDKDVQQVIDRLGIEGASDEQVKLAVAGAIGAAQQDPAFLAQGGLGNVLALNDPNARRNKMRALIRAQIEGQIASKLPAVAGAGPMRAFAQILQDIGAGKFAGRDVAAVKVALAATFGGQAKNAIAEALAGKEGGPVVERLLEQSMRIQAAQERLLEIQSSEEATPEDIARAQADLDQAVGDFNATQEQLRGVLAEKGVDLEKGVLEDPRETLKGNLEAARKAQAALEKALKDESKGVLDAKAFDPQWREENTTRWLGLRNGTWGAAEKAMTPEQKQRFELAEKRYRGLLAQQGYAGYQALQDLAQSAEGIAWLHSKQGQDAKDNLTLALKLAAKARLAGNIKEEHENLDMARRWAESISQSELSAPPNVVKQLEGKLSSVDKAALAGKSFTQLFSGTQQQLGLDDETFAKLERERQEIRDSVFPSGLQVQIATSLRPKIDLEELNRRYSSLGPATRISLDALLESGAVDVTLGQDAKKNVETLINKAMETSGETVTGMPAGMSPQSVSMNIGQLYINGQPQGPATGASSA